MWGMKTRSSAPAVQIGIHRAALEAIYDECDRYDDHETGGRLIGTFRKGGQGRLLITVNGVIELSPGSRRSATSFFQDGDYQEKIFRTLETKHPEIEHLGNWHTHHVNGYPTLSEGDRQTYARIVNHTQHNTDFFYALLVVARNHPGSKERYTIKHYVVFRGDSTVYEVPASSVRIVDRPILWPEVGPQAGRPVPPVVGAQATRTAPPPGASPERGRDSQFLEEWYPSLRPYMSKETGTIYWRGPLTFIDDSAAEVVVGELEERGRLTYRVVVKGEPAASTDAVRTASNQHFTSARQAVVQLQREVDREMFKRAQSK